MFVVFAVLLNFMVYQNTMFRSVDKIADTLTRQKSPENPFLYEGQDSNEVEASLSTPAYFLTRTLLLSLSLMLAMKLP